MKNLDIRLLRMIKHSKGQFISVTIVVAVALCIYVSFNMTAINMKNTVDDYYRITNLSDIHVQLVKIPEGALEALKNMQGIERIQGRISFDVPLQVKDEKEKVRIRIISISNKEEQINKLYMLKGYHVKGENKNVVILEQFAKARKIKLGDKITPYINGKIYQLNVAGIAASSEYVYLMENERALLPAPEKFGVAYVNEAFAQSIYGYNGSYNELLITVKDPKKINEIADKLEERLDKYGVKRVIKREDQLSNKMLTEEIRQLNKTSTVIPVLFLIVAAVIIFIMLSRIVKNDRMAIGVLKALGYGNMAVLGHYIKYVLAIGVVGAAIGMSGGIFLSSFLADLYIQFYNIPFLKLDIYYGYILYGIILTSAFCIGSGWMGAKSVLQIMPADSMRPETPREGKRIFVENISFIWHKVTFSWKMVIRNIARNKKRFAFLVLGMALTYGIHVVPIFQADALTSIFSLQYGEIQKMDYIIEFSRPMNKRIMNDLKHIIIVDEIEPKLEYPFEIRRGWREKIVNIVGVPKRTIFYNFKDQENQIVKVPDDGLLITEGLAKILKIKRGDKITIKNFIPGKEDVEVEVKGIIKQYLGANGYMNIKSMETLLAEKEMITGVSVASKDHVEEKLRNIKNISSVQSIEDMRHTFVQFLDSVMYATGVLMLFGGVLGFAIVYNATMISISERRMEFSSLRVMGFDKKDIYHMVAKENFLMTGIAILIGIPLGWGMCNGIAQAFNTEMYTIPVIITPKIFIMAAVATVFIVFIAQLATLRKIYNLNFIDALKNRIS